MKMMKIVIVLLLSFGVSNLALAHATIGIFDVNRAVFETEAWKAQLESLEQEFSEEQATVAELRSELTDLFENLETNSATLTQTEIRRIQEEGEFKRLRLQQIGERVQASLRNTQNNFLERYRALLGNAIDEVYEGGSYDLILRSDSVVASRFTLDVTPEVTAKLNELIASTSQ